MCTARIILRRCSLVTGSNSECPIFHERHGYYSLSCLKSLPSGASGSFTSSTISTPPLQPVRLDRWSRSGWLTCVATCVAVGMDWQAYGNISRLVFFCFFCVSQVLCIQVMRICLPLLPGTLTSFDISACMCKLL